MKIVWNTPSAPNQSKPTETESQLEIDTVAEESEQAGIKIVLPKPKGQWIDETQIQTTLERAPSDDDVNAVIHVPEQTREQLQRLSIQEINLYEQDNAPSLTITESTVSTTESEALEEDQTVLIAKISTKTIASEKDELVKAIEAPMAAETEATQHIIDVPVQFEVTDSAITSKIEVLPTEAEITREEITETEGQSAIVLPSALVEIDEFEHITQTLSKPANDPRISSHQAELRQMAVFCLSVFTLSLIPYTSPALADYRPWTSNEAPPLIGLWTANQKITEDASGSLVAVASEEIMDGVHTVMNTVEEEEALLEEGLLEEAIQEEEDLQAINDIAVVVPREDHLSPLEPRSPARPEKLHVPQGALDKYFTQLSLIEDGGDRVVRALVWGDSTIASDGIIKDVRERMQDRFGDAGPGFLAAEVDKRWAFRRDIVRNTEGTWSAKNIVFGGADDSRYGLAGTVSIAHPNARSTLGGVEVDDVRQPLHRFQVFYQRNPTGGDLVVSTKSKSKTLTTKSEHLSDSYFELIVPEGDPYVYLESKNSNVTIYGVAMEVDAPGVTWETFGVAGSSISSMQKQNDAHLSNQIAARDPALLVYWTGGNELGYPSLKSATGKSYKKYYRHVVRNLKAGAPQASCLLIGPLDQAMREDGKIVSKPTLDKLIQFQREVAEEEGCAYWDARAAMGGADAFKEWLSYTPALASPDLAHLTGRGRKRIGDTLADVMMREYDLWRIDNPEIFWTPEESIADPNGDLGFWECDNPEVSVYELQLAEAGAEDVCKL